MENDRIRDDSARESDTTAVGVQGVLRQVHQELRQLLQQRADVIQRICTIKKTIVGLASLMGDEVVSSELRELVSGSGSTRKPGLTQACRVILMRAGRPMSARAVRDRIEETSPNILTGHKDSMASVTTILTRLVTYGEARVMIATNGKRAWQWAGGVTTANEAAEDEAR